MLYLDLETRSDVDLIFRGLRRYAEHPSTGVICMAYAFDDGPIEFWWSTEKFPAIIVEHFMNGGLITAHNAEFERHMFEWCIAPKYGFEPPALEQWRCSMVQALTNGYPAGLEKLANLLNLKFHKHKEGPRLIREYCAVGHKDIFDV
jgi:DNA polymerase